MRALLVKLVRALVDRPALASSLLSALVFIFVFAAWRGGLFQFLELKLYDQALRNQGRRADTDSPLTIVGVTDDDIARFGWPLDDAKMADLLDKLGSLKPRVIGLDLYRDLPEPRSGRLLPALERVLKTSTNIICTFNLNRHTPPPPQLHDRRDQLGFNDLPADGPVEKIVRRGLLYMDDASSTTHTSFALQIALRYLAHEGIVPQAYPPKPASTPPAFRRLRRWFSPGPTAGDLKLGQTTFRPFEANDGPYIQADAGGYQFVLDFKGPTRFQTISIHQVLEEQITPGFPQGRVFLVGMMATSVKDHTTTPLNSEQFGVEVHAHAVDQLVRSAVYGEAPIRPLTEWVEFAWIVLWCSSGAVLGFCIRSPLWLVLALIACVAVLIGMFQIFFVHSWWIPVVAPAASCVPAAALVVSFRAYHERSYRSMLMSIFSRHVSKDIADDLWAKRNLFLDGGRPRPQKLTATVLFTDLKAFSSISETMDPTELATWLNLYMDRMASCVIAHGGSINKYIGDAVMAVFGVPLAREKLDEQSQDAISAVRCALAMGSELANLNQQWHKKGMQTVSMRVGIHTGALVAAEIGSSERLEYTVIGDTVNTASRLESFDKNVADPDLAANRCRILIGEPTLQLLHCRFETRLVGEVNVKGKKQPVTIYLVLAEQQLVHSTS